MDSAEGGCACGAVRYVAQGQPSNTGWVRFGDGLPGFQEFRNDQPG